MEAQNLFDTVDREGCVEVANDIWLYTKLAIIEANGSQFADPNPYEEDEINLLTAPYWWTEVGMGSWIYPIHNSEDLQKHLDELMKGL